MNTFKSNLLEMARQAGAEYMQSKLPAALEEIARMKRYTIEFRVMEVDAEGETFGDECAGMTLDITSTEVYSVEEAMHAAWDAATDELKKIAMEDSIEDRRPEEAA